MMNKKEYSHLITQGILESSSRGKDWYTVASGSMSPSLRIGQSIRVIPVKYHDLVSGQVVAVKIPGHLPTVHRLLLIKNFLAVTKGDNSLYSDPPVSVFDIIGIVDNCFSPETLRKSQIRSFVRRNKLLAAGWKLIKALRPRKG